jgi:hypothetical protein
MKKVLFAVIAVAGLTPAGFAAAVGNSSMANPNRNIPVSNNRIVSAPADPADGVSGRVHKHFSQNYAMASNVKWIDFEDGVEAIFKTQDVLTRVYYKKNGNWNYSIISYPEKYMPTEIRALVKSEYYDYQIKIVNEINTPDKTVYLINLEDEKTLITLRVCDGEKQVVSSLYKID